MSAAIVPSEVSAQVIVAVVERLTLTPRAALLAALRGEAPLVEVLALTVLADERGPS